MRSCNFRSWDSGIVRGGVNGGVKFWNVGRGTRGRSYDRSGRNGGTHDLKSEILEGFAFQYLLLIYNIINRANQREYAEGGHSRTRLR